MSAALSDDELLSRAVAGDRRSFGELARRHQRKARALAWRLTRDADDVEDVVQEAFIRVFIYLPPPGTNFAACVYTAVSQCAYGLREKRFGRQRCRSFVDVDELTLESAAPRVDDSLEEHEARARLRKEIAGLPDVPRRVFELLLEGLTHGEVGAGLGMPSGTVNTHVSRGTKKLSRAVRKKVRRPPPTAKVEKTADVPRRPALTEVAKRAGVSAVTLWRRRKRGMTLEEAVAVRRYERG